MPTLDTGVWKSRERGLLWRKSLPYPGPEESQWSDTSVLPEAEGMRPQGEHLENLTSAPRIWETEGLVCHSSPWRMKVKAVAKAVWNGRKTQPDCDLVCSLHGGQERVFSSIGPCAKEAAWVSITKSLYQEDHLEGQRDFYRENLWGGFLEAQRLGSRSGWLYAASWSKQRGPAHLQQARGSRKGDPPDTCKITQ